MLLWWWGYAEVGSAGGPWLWAGFWGGRPITLCVNAVAPVPLGWVVGGGRQGGWGGDVFYTWGPAAEVGSVLAKGSAGGPWL